MDLLFAIFMPTLQKVQKYIHSKVVFLRPFCHFESDR